MAVSEKASKQPAQQPKAAKKQASPLSQKSRSKKGQKPEPEKEPEPVPAAPAEPHHDEELAAAFVSLDEIVAKIRRDRRARLRRGRLYAAFPGGRDALAYLRGL